MKKDITTACIYVALITIIAFLVTGFLSSCNRELKKEIELLREELARQQQYVPLERGTIRDSVKTITQKVVEVERIKEVLSDEERKLIKDFGIKVNELETLQKTGIETKDTVPMEKKDSTENAPFIYKDAWAEFEYRDNRLAYSIRDSLAIAVEREYRHKLLWWKWKVKGYNVKVANFNPHTNIRYNTFVKRE